VCTAIVFTFVVKGWIQESLTSGARSNLKTLRHEQYEHMAEQTREDLKGNKPKRKPKKKTNDDE